MTGFWVGGMRNRCSIPGWVSRCEFSPKRPDLPPEVHPASCSGYIGDVLRGVKLPGLGSNAHLAPVCTSCYCRQFTAIVSHKFSIFPSYLGSFPQALILQSVPVIAVYVVRYGILSHNRRRSLPRQAAEG